MEIRLTEMNASDEIEIRTQFSNYSFRVVDPEQCRGVLSGGRLDQEHEAIFLEPIRPTGHLGPGDRAVFLVGGNIFKRLITSTISEIIVAQPVEASPDDC